MSARWRTARGVRAVLFDLGGTVVSMDHPRIERTLREAGVDPPGDWVGRAEREGRRACDQLVRGGAAPGEVYRGFFDAFLGAAGAAPAQFEALYQALDDFHRRQHLWNRVIAGVPDALGSLARSGYRLAAISNSDGRAEWLLQQLGLAREFEFVLDSADVGVDKPDPRIFLLALERLGLAADECAYVGDVLSIDVEGSAAAGLRPILLDHYGSYRTEELPDGVPRAVEASEIPAGLESAPAARREGEE